MKNIFHKLLSAAREALATRLDEGTWISPYELVIAKKDVSAAAAAVAHESPLLASDVRELSGAAPSTAAELEEFLAEDRQRAAVPKDTERAA